MLNDIGLFDPQYFNYSPREASWLDPQQRLFLECCVQALDYSGYGNAEHRGVTGVFGGTGFNNYMFEQLWSTRADAEDRYSAVLGNAPDYVATRVSYKLGLTGPSMCVQTACSTSLVAVNLAIQSLLEGQCDLALAGAACVRVPQTAGYVHVEGGILSSDGHCRPFDADASGTVNGCGVAVAVLRRLEDAIADGDRIRAVILGSAVNNDGAHKVGFTAPNVQAQADVMTEALAVAGVEPDSIGFVEAHGSGTSLGDAIELESIDQVFAASDRREDLVIGSAKSNLGHLDAAAGMASLVKAVLALEHRQIPPTVNFRNPASQSPLDRGCFRVNTTLEPWEDSPRRAGVSSFGFGGTNAHIVLEEAPPQSPSIVEESQQVLCLSARSEAALEQMSVELADALRNVSDASLADIAFTLQVGRRIFHHRRAIVCRTVAEAIDRLERASVEDPGPIDTECEEFRLAARWQDGEDVDWSSLHANCRRHRVELPSYPFERQLCWAVATPEETSGNSAGQRSAPSVVTPTSLIHVPGWRRVSRVRSPQTDASHESYAIFSTGDALSARIAHGLKDRGARVRMAGPAAKHEDGLDREDIDLSDAGAYEDLLRRWTADQAPTVIVHCVSLTPQRHASVDRGSWVSRLESSFGSLFLLARALARHRDLRKIRLEIVTAGTQEVIGSDCVDPWSATVAGPRLVLPQELIDARCRQIDIDPECARAATGRTIERVVDEIVSPAIDSLVTLRGDNRWLPTAESVGETLSTLPAWHGWRRKGVYLITGGSGGLGQKIAATLRHELDARTVLLSRNPASGGDNSVDSIACDVCEPADLDDAVRSLVDRHGRIDGVIHAAGVPGGGLIHDRSIEDAEQVLAPKVLGTVNLLEALAALEPNRRPSFVLLCSSLVATRGSVGQVDYCAANAFQDSLAEARGAGHPRVISLAWDRWRDVGMSAGTRARRSAVRRHDQAVSLAPWRWFESEHRLSDRAMVPGVALLGLGIERMTETAGDRHGAVPKTDSIGLSQVTFLRPFEQTAGRQLYCRIEHHSGADTLKFVSSSGAEEDETVHCILDRDATGRLAADHDLPDDWRDRLAGAKTISEQQIVEQSGSSQLRHLGLTLGPRWNALRQLATIESGREWLARFELADRFRDDVDTGPFHPSLLDVATGYALQFESPGLFVPLSLRDVYVAARRFPRNLVSHVRRMSGAPGSDSVSYRVLIADRHGKTLLAVGEYLLRRLDADANTSSEPTIARDRAPGIETTEFGLNPDTAADVLAHVLQPGLPCRLLIGEDPMRMPANSDASSRGRAIESDGVTGEAVRTVAADRWISEQWQRLLGVDSVGLTDDFFALGGDSVLALEATAEMNREGWRISPADLFDHPTPSRLAAAIADMAEATSEAASESADVDEPGSASGSGLSRFRSAGIDEDELEEIAEEFGAHELASSTERPK